MCFEIKEILEDADEVEAYKYLFVCPIKKIVGVPTHIIVPYMFRFGSDEATKADFTAYLLKEMTIVRQ